jgi:hypothetical protein
MLLLNILIAYAIASVVGYLIMDNLYNTGVVVSLPNVKCRWLYYLLQFTWGLPMNFIGALVALVLMCHRKKAYKYGWNYCFELPVNFGLELGIFFIAPMNGSKHTKDHEHAHAIQNIYFGPFCVGMVSIPSATRFRIREIQYKIKKPPKTKYDDAWFEGQASKSGARFIDGL